MTRDEEFSIRAIIEALYVKRNRFGALDSGHHAKMDALTKRYPIPHGGYDVVDKSMMILQSMIGDPCTSIIDAIETPSGSLKPKG